MVLYAFEKSLIISPRVVLIQKKSIARYCQLINPDAGGRMEKIVAVVIGGGSGALIRWLVSGAVQNRSDSFFPWGTFVVNITGCFVMGCLWNLFEEIPVSPAVRLFFITGVLGGYTTFSSFGIETINLMRDNEFAHAAANILFSNALGLAAVFAGIFISRFVLQAFRG
jgi:CrcB protein